MDTTNWTPQLSNMVAKLRFSIQNANDMGRIAPICDEQMGYSSATCIGVI